MAAVIMCMLFVIVDLGKPARLFNIIFHPAQFHPFLGYGGVERLPAPEFDYRLRVLEAERIHCSLLLGQDFDLFPYHGPSAFHTVTAFLCRLARTRIIG